MLHKLSLDANSIDISYDELSCDDYCKLLRAFSSVKVKYGIFT